MSEEKLKNIEPIILNNWHSIEDLKKSFWPSYCNGYQYDGELECINIFLASYGTPDYEGYAFVLFEHDGKLYEVNGSHCSCYELEGQWDPELTSVEELRHRLDNGNLGADDYTENLFADELRKVLDELSAEKVA
jgi:hypothetical protein